MKSKTQRQGCGCIALLIFGGLILYLLGTQSQTPQQQTAAAPTSSNPADQLKAIVSRITTRDVSSIEVDAIDSQLITFKYPLNTLSADAAKLDAKVTMPEIVCALKDFSIKPAKYIVYGVVPVKDAYGNQSIGNGVIMTLTQPTLGKFNCKNLDAIDIENAADSYTIMPVLQ